MNTTNVERFDIYQFGHSVEMVMASAHDEMVERMQARILELELKVSDQYIESIADTMLIQRVIAENSHLRSDIDVIGNVLNSSINYAARYLDAHKSFRAHIKSIASDECLTLGGLRETLFDAINQDHY